MIDSLTSPLLLGLVAGLAVAVPLGPMGLLILDRGMRRGLPTALAAAGGVAGVDLAYAVVAIAATGAVAGAVEPFRVPLTVVVATVLAALGLRGLLAARGVVPVAVGASPTPEPPTGASPWRTFAGFAALTAINPGTLVHFGALAVAVGGRLDGVVDRVTFVVAVGTASLSWQAVLAVAGTRLGRSPRPRVQRWTRVAGSCLLLVFATVLLVDAL